MEGRERAPQVSGRRALQAEGAAGAKALGWGWAWPAEEPGRPVWPGQRGEEGRGTRERGSQVKLCGRWEAAGFTP